MFESELLLLLQCHPGFAALHKSGQQHTLQRLFQVNFDGLTMLGDEEGKFLITLYQENKKAVKMGSGTHHAKYGRFYPAIERRSSPPVDSTADSAMSECDL